MLVDEPGGTYWKRFAEFVREEMLAKGLVSPDDLGLFRSTDDVDDAVSEILDFYRVYHSQRYVGDNLVFRIRHQLSPAALAEVNESFADILTAPAEQAPGPLKAEHGELPDLPRLILPFNRMAFARLRPLIDLINRS